VRMVVVNGRVAVDGDRHTGMLAGRVLRGAHLSHSGART
jgi:hypothetical protein